MTGRFTLLGLLLSLIGGCIIGCNGGLLDSHVKQLDVLNGMAASASTRLSDGSMGIVTASGQAMEPGVTVEACVIYRASAYYKGMSGQFAVASAGKLGPQLDREQIWAIMRDKSLSDAERLKFFDLWVSKAITTTKPPVPEPATP